MKKIFSKIVKQKSMPWIWIPEQSITNKNIWFWGFWGFWIKDNRK